MAKQINWTNLTPSESKTLEQLESAGKEVFEAPIEIESTDQLHAMGLTWEQCRTWYFGTKRVTVHLTPSDEQTYPSPVGEYPLLLASSIFPLVSQTKKADRSARESFIPH